MGTTQSKSIDMCRVVWSWEKWRNGTKMMSKLEVAVPAAAGWIGIASAVSGGAGGGAGGTGPAYMAPVQPAAARFWPGNPIQQPPPVLAEENCQTKQPD